jgi:hypothetical protein
MYVNAVSPYLALPRARVDACADECHHIRRVLAEAGEDEECDRVVQLLLAVESDGEVDDGGVDEEVEDSKDDRGLQNALVWR